MLRRQRRWVRSHTNNRCACVPLTGSVIGARQAQVRCRGPKYAVYCSVEQLPRSIRPTTVTVRPAVSPGFRARLGGQRPDVSQRPTGPAGPAFQAAQAVLANGGVTAWNTDVTFPSPDVGELTVRCSYRCPAAQVHDAALTRPAPRTDHQPQGQRNDGSVSWRSVWRRLPVRHAAPASRRPTNGLPCVVRAGGEHSWGGRVSAPRRLLLREQGSPGGASRRRSCHHVGVRRATVLASTPL